MDGIVFLLIFVGAEGFLCFLCSVKTKLIVWRTKICYNIRRVQQLVIWTDYPRSEN